ncbi:UDP-glucose 4-epimerase GalE [[Mycoplasma] testudinis]|uniref:UDP-glucose 4-epimerase GalE n=1 Tax=[Mycoplasma] testudinis TaxID=33924 RepID=UPI000489E570|nr:UDP-glucose 4-epimerase GalE [[Mycoplasma] testudinis]
MKYFLIGGAGYIGSNVAFLLSQDKKNQVLVYDNLSTGSKRSVPKNAAFVLADQLDFKKLNETMKKFKPDVVMHFAAKIIVSESVSMPVEYYENNVGGMINIIKAMRLNNITRLIFSSTAATYGMPENIPVAETDVTNPINPYGSSKLACEYLIKAAEVAYGIKAVIFRYFNVAGASDNYDLGIFNKNTTLLLPRIIRSVLQGEQLSVFGTDYDTRDGSCIRDYIHVVDLAKAHLLAADYLQKAKKTIIANLGTNKGYTVLECLKEVEKVLKIKVNFKKAKRRPGDPEVLLTSNKNASKILKWKPLKSLADMIKSEYEFEKKHGPF